VSFAVALPWWGLVLGAATLALLAWRTYASAPFGRGRRLVLAGLRAATLLLLAAFLLRPVAIERRSPRDLLVPVLVDTSRSMALADASGGRPRVEHAVRLAADRIAPALGARFAVELLGFDETVGPLDPARPAAGGRASDLAGAIAAVRERHAGRALAGIVVISDGASTTPVPAPSPAAEGPPVYAIGVGRSPLAADREVLDVALDEEALPGSMIDLTATFVSHGYRAQPIDVRLLENGRPVEVRRVRPAADGAPVRETFRVPPAGDAPTVYTVEIPPAPGEVTRENNTRSAVVQPIGRARRLLVLQGAPGFDHAFLARSWAADPGLEVDSVVRKGRTERGEPTFYIQAAEARAPALASGLPADRAALFAYDAVVLANVGADLLPEAAQTALERFVAERGGGLLVFGARSFAPDGVAATAVADLLPLSPHARAPAAVQVAISSAQPNRVALTPAGLTHPLLRPPEAGADAARRWLDAPALADVVPLGAPRPGAQVLAAASTAGGGLRPLVAIQRYGEGRTMVFAGEATWRWKMLRPAGDRLYDTFWRQTARWLSAASPEPVLVTAGGDAQPGGLVRVVVTARDEAFEPAPDAEVTLGVRAPDGEEERLSPTPTGEPGRFAAAWRPRAPGVHVVEADARRGGVSLGRARRAVLVGGADVEMTDPRRHDDVLARIAAASGGRLIGEGEIDRLGGLLEAGAARSATLVTRELWHGPWTLAIVIALLSVEWSLRRRWGLR
jgi:uncharacterized membrane protein